MHTYFSIRTCTISSAKAPEMGGCPGGNRRTAVSADDGRRPEKEMRQTPRESVQRSHDAGTESADDPSISVVRRFPPEG